jgi:hypothetical protein
MSVALQTPGPAPLMFALLPLLAVLLRLMGKWQTESAQRVEVRRSANGQSREARRPGRLGNTWSQPDVLSRPYSSATASVLDLGPLLLLISSCTVSRVISATEQDNALATQQAVCEIVSLSRLCKLFSQFQVLAF